LDGDEQNAGLSLELDLGALGGLRRFLPGHLRKSFWEGLSMRSPAPPQPDFDVQMQFVRHNFEDHQSLIRFADSKAAVLLTLLMFLGASNIPIAREALPKLRFVVSGEVLASGLYLSSCTLLLVSFFWTLILVYLVVAPRGPQRSKSPRLNHGLAYFGHVLLHADQDEYFASICGAAPEQLLRDLTDQVYELANICQQKMAYLKKALLPLFLSFCFWAISIALGLWIQTWK
jgi:hypothetical protein